MNNPHVEALIYRVVHSETIEYQGTREIERCEFRVEIEDDQASFYMKEHFANVQDARAAIQPFIEQWEFEETLKSGPGTFSLWFDHPKMIDRDPTPGIISISFHVSSGSPEVRMSVTVCKPYPQPPSDVPMDIRDPDVQTIFNRFQGYRQGHEPLPSMAYFCCEVFTKRLSNGIKDAADRHKISRNLIDKVNNLSANKGGDQARHASAIADLLTPCETQFLEKAVVAIVIRAAKVAADPNQPMEKITVGNLRTVSL